MTAQERAAALLAAADRAEAAARHSNGERIINCPNESKGEAALRHWRRTYPYVDPDKARVLAVAKMLEES